MAEVPYDDIFLNITSTFNKKGVENAINALRGLQGITGFSGLKRAGEDLKGFVDTLNGLSEDKMKTITEFAKAIKGVGGIGTAMKAVSNVAEKGNPLNDTSIGEAPVPQMAGSMKQVAESAKEAKEATKEVGKEAKKALTPMEKLANRFKSFLQYRAMRAVWSAITNGIKEGFSNLEAWDRRVGNTGFAEAMDRARESLLVLKNSLAVVGAPFLEGLISVLQQVASWAMTSANAISRLFAILGGKSSYRAVKWADYTANAVKGTTGAVKDAGKEFEKQLMAFDEINNITEQKGSSGGGGYGNSGYFNYDDMFEEREVGQVSEVEAKLKEIWEWIKKIVNELTPIWARLKDIGKVVAEVWESFKEFAKTIYNNFASPLENVWRSVKRVAESCANLFVSAIELVGDTVSALLEVFGAITDLLGVFGVWEDAGWKVKFVLDEISWELDLVAGTFQVVSYVVKTLGYYIDYVATAIGEFWKLATKKESLEDFKTNMKEAEDVLLNKVKKASDDLKESLKNTFDHTYKVKTDASALDAVKASADSLNGKTIRYTIYADEKRYVHYYDKDGNEISGVSGKFASGGFPSTGQLFIAREAGAEMVGQIGGHTAVANNQDIVASVSQGVAQAVASVMGGGSNVTVTLEGDAKGIFKVVQKEGRAYSARTGQPALA